MAADHGHRVGARDVVTPQGRSQLHSTVGIVRYSADAADAGTPFYLTLLAYISLSLAIFNLLPFLPLDGGHVFIVLGALAMLAILTTSSVALSY